MKRSVLFVFLLTAITGNSQSLFQWNARTQQIYESITALRIPEARKLILTEKKTQPDNLCFQVLESYADVYQLFFNENRAEYNSLYPNFSKRIDLVKDGPKNSPFYNYSLGILHLNKAIIAIRFNKNLEAAWDFRKAFILFKENKEKFPDFSPNDVYFGLLTTIIGSVPNNYQWILGIIGMKGSITKGNAMVLNYINSKDELSRICRNEALLIYPYLVMNFEGNKKKTLEFLEKSDLDFKKNHMHAYMATNLYLSNQQSAKAIEVANGIQMSDAYLSMPFWNYEKGFAYLNQLKLDQAAIEFSEFTNKFKGKFYLKDAYEKLSWIAYLKGDQKKADEYRSKVITEGSDITDADKLALENAHSNKWPNNILLQARLLSDGGLENQALNLLIGKTSNDFNSDADKTEFAYRLARIYDLMGNKDQAIKFYKSTIAHGTQLKEYFASRAALQAGMIYEERKDIANAKYYYELCLSMKDHAFKNSIDQKAKSGLLRCNKAS